MQTIPAQEIKRRGLAAVDAMLPNGPVHVIRNNRPAAVVLSPEAFEELARKAVAAGRVAPGSSIWEFIQNRPAPTWKPRTRAEIDAELRAERDSWDDR